jgi:DNA-binding response OmpR family regulator
MGDLSRVLLVDDDHDFCDSVASYFEERGLAVLTATDARFLHSMDLDDLRVILLDIDMPRLSGLDALEVVRQQNDHVTTIMVSGHSDLTTRLSCLDKGADFFMAKPIDLAELYLVVQRVVGREEEAASNDPRDCWQLSRSRHALVAPNGDELGLSASEYRVLDLLFANSPEPVSREELTEAATGRLDVAKTYSRALEVLISRLRTRSSSEGQKLPVKALRNAGYVFHGVCKMMD